MILCLATCEHGLAAEPRAPTPPYHKVSYISTLIDGFSLLVLMYILSFKSLVGC